MDRISVSVSDSDYDNDSISQNSENSVGSESIDHLEIEDKKEKDGLEVEEFDEDLNVSSTQWKELPIDLLPHICDAILKPATIRLNSLSPIELFESTIGNKLITLLTEETNLYAARKLTEEDTLAHLENNPYSRWHRWVETNRNEMRRYLAIILSMALTKRGSIQDYWASMICFPSELPKIMSIRRFEILEHFLQINNKSYESNTSIQKLEPLLRLFEEFNAIYDFSSKIAIDEIIAPFSGRFKYLTYNPQKLDKWGIRIIGVADATSSYCLSLIPQLGQETYDYYKCKNLDDLVMLQAERFSKPGTCLYIDNYYWHVSLVERLKSKGINVTGTFRETRKDVPTIIKEAQVKKVVKSNTIESPKPKKKIKTPPKDIRYFESSKHVYAIKWKAKKIITLLTTNHPLNYEFKQTARNKTIQRPIAIHEYIKYMRGIDRVNQKAHYIKFTHKNRKWWKKFFYSWLAISIVNCHTIYTRFFKREISMREFQTEIIHGLLAKSGLNLSPQNQMINEHYFVKIDGFPKRCKVCYVRSQTDKCSRSSYKCFGCSQESDKDIALCIECFKDFHNNRNELIKMHK